MPVYNLIIFDLDGTLTDPKEGITKSVGYALLGLGFVVPDPDSLVSFIGPPLIDSFKMFYPLSATRAREAVELYREYYSRCGIYENKLYPGITSLLHRLKSSGKGLAVATSKPSVFAEIILKHFNLFRFFSMVTGSNLDGTMVNKSELIKHVIDRTEKYPKEEVVMVGDRCFDIIGARDNGIDSVAVTYGYGPMEELKAANPTGMVNSVSELAALLSIQGD